MSSKVLALRRALPSLTRSLTGYTRQGGAWVRDDVAEAVAAHRPVIALESTIISHGVKIATSSFTSSKLSGMPYPENVHTALELEDLARTRGVVPATVGIIDGDLVVGISPAHIEILGRTGHVS